MSEIICPSCRDHKHQWKGMGLSDGIGSTSTPMRGNRMSEIEKLEAWYGDGDLEVRNKINELIDAVNELGKVEDE